MYCETCGAPMEWEPCATCDGDGGYFAFDGEDWTLCPTCDGDEGWWTCREDHAGVFGSDGDEP